MTAEQVAQFYRDNTAMIRFSAALPHGCGTSTNLRQRSL